MRVAELAQALGLSKRCSQFKVGELGATRLTVEGEVTEEVIARVKEAAETSCKKCRASWQLWCKGSNSVISVINACWILLSLP